MPAVSSGPVQGAPQLADQVVPLRPHRVVPRVGRRIAAGLMFVAAGGVVLLVMAVSSPIVRLVVAALVCLAVPTSRELSRRVLVAGCVVIGWVPMTWWWRVPLGSVGHAGALLALTVGGLAAWLAWSDTRRKARSLLPRARLIDLWLAGSVAVIAWINEPRLVTTTPEVAMSRLLLGWDNVAHFNMTEMIRRYGVMIIHAPAPPHGEWTYGAYPQGFHAVAATVMEMLVGVRVQDPAVELGAYAHALTVVAVVAVATVVAGLCSLPALRRRPLLALPLVAFVVATFGLGPGGLILNNGFPNYFVAVAMLCCIPLVVVQASRPGSLPMLVAVSGAALGVAHNWALLLVLGALAVVAAAFPWRRSRWPSSKRAWTLAGLVVIATAIGGAAAWSLLRAYPSLVDILKIKGGISPVPVNPVILETMLAAAAAASIGFRVRRRPSTQHGDEAVRVGWLALVPAGGFLVAALVAAIEIRNGGDVTYYFWKVAIALQIVSVVVLCSAVPFVVRRPEPVRGRWVRLGRALGRSLASVAVAAAVFQAYGAWHVFPTQIGGPAAPGIQGRLANEALAKRPIEDARLLLDAVRATSGNRAPAVFAVPSPTGKVDGFLLVQWYYALTGTWTTSNDELLREFRVPNGADVEAVTRTTQAALAARPDVVVVVAPEMAHEVRDAVTAAQRDRILTW